MPSKKSENQVMECVRVAYEKDIGTLYRAACFTWKGATRDTGEPCTEVAAKWLLENHRWKKLEDIRRSGRPAYWGQHGIQAPDNQDDRQKEPRLARKWCRNSENLGSLGEVIEYQVPLSARRADRAGKIDLVTWGKKGQILNLVELKLSTNREPLLSSILQVATYARVLDQCRFLEEAREKKDINPKKLASVVLFLTQAGEVPHAIEAAGSVEKYRHVHELGKKMGVTLWLGEPDSTGKNRFKKLL